MRRTATYNFSVLTNATKCTFARYVAVTKEIEMKKMLAMAALAAVVSTSAIVPTAPASAGYYDSHHVYHATPRRYRHKCGGGNGAVGTVAGGVGGAVLGSALGGGTLGTVAGGVGGALLGRHLDKSHTRHRNGC
jgi:uncharacterized protein YcfJ